MEVFDLAKEAGKQIHEAQVNALKEALKKWLKHQK
jgi:hypothetical protein